MKTHTGKLLGVTSAVCLLAWAPATPVHAQEQLADDQILEEIVTTGSRIRPRRTSVSASPLTVVGGQDVLESGMSNLGEALREQAQAVERRIQSIEYLVRRRRNGDRPAQPRS